MKNKLIILSLIIFSVFSFSHKTLASITNGTIDPTYHYAWGENIGFVDFKNITISDTKLSGSIYGENIGWIDLSTITNTTEGKLGGYAWGENIGWVDFSKVKIGTDGMFTGEAYGENIGWITFGITTNKVLTDWRPQSVRPVSSHGGGYYRPSIVSIITPPTITTLPTISQNTPIITRILKLNTKGEDVKQLQIYLNTHGYPISNTGVGSLGKETNTFGSKTKQALIKFQKANNLKADGIVGPITISKLK